MTRIDILEEQGKEQGIDASVASIVTRLGKLEEQGKIVTVHDEKIDGLQFDHELANKAFKDYRESTSTQIGFLLDRIDYLENMSRRNNIIIVGISEQETETWETIKTLVRVFLKDKLKIEDTNIERAHRLGARKGERPRPIIAKLHSLSDKSKIMSQRFLLKQTGLFVNEDYSPKFSK